MTRELVEAAKAVLRSVSRRSHWDTLFVKSDSIDALRAAVRAAEAAPAPDTVAVPVAAIRRLKSTVSSFGVGVPDWARRAREAVDEITKLLPPPPAPEPSAELRERWLSEAMDVFHAAAGISREEFDLIEARREGYVAARRAEWAKKGGG